MGERWIVRLIGFQTGTRYYLTKDPQGRVVDCQVVAKGRSDRG